MEAFKTKECDEISSSMSTEYPNIDNVKNQNLNIEVENCVDKKPILSTASKDLNACVPKTSESDFIVQNILFDMKSEEFNTSTNFNKTNLNCNIKPYDKNIFSSMFNTTSTFNVFDETQVFTITNGATYSSVNNTASKKQSFSIEEISKDETSQNSQTMSKYSNDYTCFLSEQTDAVNNLTPFKRSNSYYFDSPVKKLCNTKLPNEENINEMSNRTLYSNENDNKLYTGFTSIQNDLEVDCIQDRYDGSDSGFGSELAEDKNNTNLDIAVTTNTLYKNDYILNQESSFEDLQRTSNEFLSAMEVLKPKFTESILDTSPLDNNINYGMVKGILKRDRPVNYDISNSGEITTVKKRKNINFTNVTVFYFPRVQGFTCVPSQVIN